MTDVFPVARRRRHLCVAMMLGLSASLGGCNSTGDEPVHSRSLAGTSWRLVEIQSMKDEQGATKPDDPDKYTLSFGADGNVAVRLDCNRGAGAWKSESSGEDSGSITIGPLAMTRMMCLSPSLGDRLGRNLDHVRGYRFFDGKLSLNLMADSGLLIWEPIKGP